MITREELIRMRNMTFDEIDPDDAIDLDADDDIDVTFVNALLGCHDPALSC